MPDAPRELLVILEQRSATSALAQLRSVATVTQTFAPRLALIRADADTAARVARIGGVLGVYDALPELPTDFTPSEHLFASAWAERRRTKTRPGEGLPWDAPGFLPPNGPAHRRR